MKWVRRADDRIEMNIPPGLHWALAALFIIPTSLMVIASIKSGMLEGWSLQLSGIIALCVCVIVTGVIVLIRSPGITIGLQPGQDLTIDRTWYITRSREVFRWDEIGSVELHQDKDSEDSPIYKPVLILRSGRQVPLIANWSHDRQGCEAVTTEIESLLNQDE